MSKQNKVIKAGLGYTIGNILVKGINFLSIPIFSRLLTKAQFGVYNVFVSYEALLYVVIGFALHTSIKSANIEFKNKINEYTSSIALIYLINLVVFWLIALLFQPLLVRLLDFDAVVIYMLVVYSFSNAMIMLYNQRVSLQYDYKKYLVIAFCNSLGNLVLSLGFILTIFSEQRDIGRILGLSITAFIISGYILYYLFKQAKPHYNKEYWKFGLHYSLPIVPHGLSQVLLAQFDRIMIRSIVGNVEAGIYSLAANIKLVLTIITDSIATVWQTWFYEQMELGHIKEIQKRAKMLTTLFTILTVGMISICPELIYILGGSGYLEGKYVAIPMVLDAFILFIYNIVVTAEYYQKKTVYIMGGTMVAACINIITNYIFISKYGYIAAAYTTLFSYVCYLGLHLVISRKVIGFYVLPIKWLCLSSMIVIFVAVFDLFYINHLVIRWLICLLLVCLLGLNLYQQWRR